MACRIAPLSDARYRHALMWSFGCLAAVLLAMSRHAGVVAVQEQGLQFFAHVCVDDANRDAVAGAVMHVLRATLDRYACVGHLQQLATGLLATLSSTAAASVYFLAVHQHPQPCMHTPGQVIAC